MNGSLTYSLAPLYIYYAAFFGIYKEGQVVKGVTDGKKYKVGPIKCDGKVCSVCVEPITYEGVTP